MCSDLIIHMPIIAPTASASKDVYLSAPPRWYLSTLDGADFPLLYITAAAPTFRSIADPSVNILISSRLSASFHIELSLSCAISVVKVVLVCVWGCWLGTMLSTLSGYISDNWSSRLWSGVWCFFDMNYVVLAYQMVQRVHLR